MAGKAERSIQILLFKSLISYINYWDKEVVKCLSTNNEYADFIKRMKASNENAFKSSDEENFKYNIGWYGYPVPTSVKEAMDRKVFMNMPLYDRVYKKLEPFLAQLEKASVSVIPKEIIIPTELELGIFSFERAMMGIEEIPGLYSKKYDKYVSVEDGDPVLKDGKPTFTEDKKAIYTYNRSNNKEIPLGTELWLQQLEKDGEKQYGSKNKKSFLKKEFYKRPSNAIRIFVYIGGNAHQNTYWSGLIATIAAQFLQTKGYSIKITAVIGIECSDGYFNLNYKKINEAPEYKLWVDPVSGKKYDRGTRYSYIDIKDYGDTIDSLTLLYLVADSSFFRVRVFEYLTAQQFKNKDRFDSGLGSIEKNEDFKNAFYSEIKKRNIEEEKDTLYYFLGGRDFQSSRTDDEGKDTDIDKQIEIAKKNLLDIICNAENTNKKIMKELGYEFEPIENPEDYSVFIGGIEYDCIEKEEKEEKK